MKKTRIIVAKPGLDGHDRGAKIVAMALRDAGMEVIYTGLRQSPSDIVNTALQEDADVIGLSILSGAHMRICDRLLELMNERGIADKPVVVGGIIPHDDIEILKKKGIAEVFGPGTSLKQLEQRIKELVEKK